MKYILTLMCLYKDFFKKMYTYMLHVHKKKNKKKHNDSLCVKIEYR